MIIVLTGQPRHGKSQYAIKLLLDLIKDNQKRLEQGKLPREIYCNIAGINDPNTKTQLPEVQNQDIVFKNKRLWFGEHKDTPDGYIAPSRGAVFIYDECHKIEWIKEKSGTLSDNPTCISMNEHGHEDYIFILITQFPQYIHTHLRGLVEHHYHAKRSFGARASKIYKWNEFVLNPRADKSLKDAYETEKFKFAKKYQDCYASASAHDSMKIHIPKPLYYLAFTLIIILVLIIHQYNKSSLKIMVEQRQNKPIPQPQEPTQIEQPLQTETKTTEIEILQMQQQLEQMKQEIQLYQQRLDKNYQIEAKNPELRVGGVIIIGTQCQAFNAYGDKLTLEAKECQTYLTDNKLLKARPNQANQIEQISITDN